MDVPLRVLSDTGPLSLSLCSPLTMGTSQGLCDIPSNRLSSALLVFSSGFLKTQVNVFYSVTAFTNAFDKRIIMLFESRIVLMLKGRKKNLTVMLSLFLYQSSLELWWVGIQHFPTAAFLLNENPTQAIFLHLTHSTF